jgi:hypothetical protein
MPPPLSKPHVSARRQSKRSARHVTSPRAGASRFGESPGRRGCDEAVDPGRARGLSEIQEIRQASSRGSARGRWDVHLTAACDREPLNRVEPQELHLIVRVILPLPAGSAAGSLGFSEFTSLFRIVLTGIGVACATPQRNAVRGGAAISHSRSGQQIRRRLRPRGSRPQDAGHQDRGRTPDMNATCERFLGSVRRECLDHLIVLSERHLLAVLAEYVRYLNRARPHQGLNQSSPRGTHRATLAGEVIAVPVLGGLRHQCRRVA